MRSPSLSTSVVVVKGTGVVEVRGGDGDGRLLVVVSGASVTNTLQALFNTKLRTRSRVP